MRTLAPKSRRVRSWLARIGVLSLLAALPIVPVVAPQAAHASTPTCGAGTLAIARTTSSVLYADLGNSPVVDSGYEQYTVTNNTGAAIPDLWLQDEFANGSLIHLGLNGNVPNHVGALAAGATYNAYFYLQTSSTSATAVAHNVVGYTGRPSSGAAAICSAPFTTDSATVQSTGNTTVTSVVSGPNPPELGGILTLTVQGATGTMTGGIINFTPAAYSDWPADKFQLRDTSVTFTGGNTGTFANQLYFPTLLSPSTNYTITYHFTAIGATTLTTSVSPMADIIGGGPAKHTSTSQFSAVGINPIQPVINDNTLTLGVTPSALPYSGGTAAYTVTITNAGTVGVTLDDVVLTMPSTPGSLTYTASSAQFAGASIAGPTVSGSTWTFSGQYTVAAGTSKTLTFNATVPGTSGSYATSAIGHVLTTQVDTTSDSTNVPATASFTVAPQPPSVTSVTPASGGPSGGGTVTIAGQYFTAATAVSFGGTAATSYTVNSATSITATVPAHALGTVDVRVTTADGTSAVTVADQYGYVLPPAPVVTAVSPTGGGTLGGTSVTITGTSLSGATAVTFGGTAATSYVVNSDSSITAIAPVHSAGTVDIRVTTPSGTSATSSADQYTYTVPPPPTVTAVSPATGTTDGGTTVTITGTNFTGATAVSFGGTAATSYTVNSATSITATAPAGAAGTVDVTVTASGTSATSAADHYTYVVPAPAVTAVSPSTGLTTGGTSVTITGTHFTGATAVTFGGTPATSFTVNSATSITATTPTGAAGTVDVRVTTPSGTSSTVAADHYTYVLPAPTVSGLTPVSGLTTGGTTVTITGTDFTGATAVSFGGTAASSFTVVSATQITATSPAHAAGTVDVRVTTPSGTSSAAVADHFTFVPPPPVVTSVSPSGGPVGGGTTVVVTGSFFTGTTAVQIGGSAATSVTVLDDSTLSIVLPAEAAGTVDVVVTTPSGTSSTSAADQYTYEVGNNFPLYSGSASNTAQTVAVGATLSALSATDPDSDPLTYTVISGALPSGISLTSATGAFTGSTTAAGTYTAVIRVSDGRGGTDTTTLVITVVAAPALTLAVATPTNDSTPLVTGTSDADPGTSVAVSVGGQSFSTTVLGDGTFSVSVPLSLLDGPYTVHASVTTAGGTTPASAPLVVDTVAPTVTLTPFTGPTNDNTPTISGSTNAAPGSAVAISVGGQSFSATVSLAGTFSVSVPSALVDGPYTVSAAVSDPAGNIGGDSTGLVVDTVAPVVTLTPFAGPTNNSTPTISGTTNAAPASTVFISVGGQSFSATVSLAGTFNVPVPSALVDGPYTVSAAVSDAAGNVGGDSTPLVVDTVAPVVTLTPFAGPTNDSTPTISGTTNAAPASTVAIAVGGQSFSATVSLAGTFSVSVPSALVDGPYTVSAAVSDPAGNIGSDSTTLVVDTVAPTVTLTPFTGPTNDNTPAISGSTTAAPGSAVAISVGGQSFSATVSLAGTFSVSVPSALVDGPYTVTAAVSDPAGNIGSDSTSLVVDTVAPTVTLTPFAGPTNDNTPTISGSTNAAPGSTVAISVGGQSFSATVSLSGTFSAAVPSVLVDGPYTVEADVSDPAGNIGGDLTPLVVDTVAPVVTLTPFTGPTNDNTPTISGTTGAAPGSTVFISVGGQSFSATVSLSGSFSVPVPSALADGPYTVSAAVADPAGNIGSDSTPLVVDTVAPVVTLTPFAGPTNDNTPTISGSTNAAPGSTVFISVGGQSFSATVSLSGTFSATVPSALADGPYTVEADVSDPAGNIGGDLTPLVVDTVAPVVTLTPFTGPTNDNTPTISGSTSAAPGSTVAISVGGQAFSATVSLSGTFSAAVPSALVDGPYTVSAAVSDPAGNIGGDSTPLVVDTVAPVVTLTPFAGPTNDSTPTISGTTNAAPGSTVTITVGAQSFSATVSVSGTFTASVPVALPDGPFTVSAVVSDPAGNLGGDLTSLVVDTVAPVLTLTPFAGPTNDNTPTISGTTDAAPASTVFLSVGGQLFSTTVSVSGTFSVSVPSALVDGPYTVSAAVSDPAGNIGGDLTPLVVDTVAPTVTLTPFTGPTNDSTPTISGTTNAAPGSTVVISVGGQSFSATVSLSGAFSVSVPSALVDGPYTVSAAVSDPAGNIGGDSTPLVVDTTAPVVTLTPFASPTNDSTPTISGTTNAAPGSTVAISVGGQSFSATVSLSGAFSVSVPSALVDGPYTVSAAVSDPAGNIGGDSTPLMVDTVAPTLTLTPFAGPTNDNTPTISGSTNAAPGSTVSITVGAQTFSATVSVSGTFSASVPLALPDGPFTVSAVVADLAGNTGGDVTPLVVDTVPPGVTLTPFGGPTNDNTPTISGSTNAAPGSTVAISVGGQSLSATVSVSGTFSVLVPVALPDGPYTVSAAVSDPAGNIGGDSTPLVVDTVAPVVTLTPFAGPTNDRTPTISGHTDAAPGSTVTLFVAGQIFTAIVAGDGSFSADVPSDLTEGSYTVTATVLDSVGNAGSAALPVTVADATLTLTSADPAAGEQLRLSGISDLTPGTPITLTVDGHDFTTVVKADGTFDLTVPFTLPAGSYDVTARGLDSAGNPVTSTLVFSVAEAPASPTPSPSVSPSASPSASPSGSPSPVRTSRSARPTMATRPPPASTTPVSAPSSSPAALPVTEPSRLPFTGAELSGAMSAAALLIVTGTLILLWTRRRRDQP